MIVLRDRIRTVRASGTFGDPLAVRLALERGFDTTDLQPRGLPEHAILCVRAVRLRTAAARIGDCARRLREEVQSLAAGAARPFREAAPASADAVLFEDEAEMLACLARDWRRGEGRAWWWVAIFGGPASAALVERRMMASIPYVPAAIELLVEARCAGEVVAALPPAFCAGLAAALAPAFVPGAAVPAPPPPVPAGWAGADAGRTVPASRAGRAVERLAATTLAPHLAAVTGAAQRRLLVLAIAMHRMPEIASAVDFPAVVDAAVARQVDSGTEPAAVSVRRSALPESGGRSESGGRATNLLSAAAAPSPLRAPPPAELAGAAAGADRPGTPFGLPPRPPPPDPEPLAEEGVVPPGSGPPPRLHGTPPPPRRRELGARVESDFAGVFYVLTLALHLDVYADFTQPLRDRAGVLPVGDFLALVLLREHGPAVRRDPLWDVLAELSSREGDQEPGIDAAPGGPLAPWFAHACALLEEQAALALEMERGGGLAFLCARPGVIALSPARVDLYFELATHPLSIRMAGLDRNPGWVPVAGRIVELHYD